VSAPMPPHARDRRRHLQRGGGTHRGKGRLQVQIRRAFIGHPFRTSSEIYDWCYARDRSRTHSEAMRWSVRRILDATCDRLGRADTRGNPWLWRLKQPVAGGCPRRQIEIIGEIATWPILPILQTMFEGRGGDGGCNRNQFRRAAGGRFRSYAQLG
jgi:hypothetical protein